MSTGQFLKNFIKRNSYNTVEAIIVNKGYIDNEMKKRAKIRHDISQATDSQSGDEWRDINTQ